LPLWADGYLPILRYAAAVLLGDTGLDVFPLCLGGNVFGGRADEQQSFAVLDAFVEAGGNFIDTANIYAGGASEEIIGRWMAARGNRDRLVIATKVGMGEKPGLAPDRIAEAAKESLQSLQTDRIDLYYAHEDDKDTPLDETLAAFDALVKQGKVRHIAASNYSAVRLAEALEVSKRDGLSRYVALQPHYNLVVRDEYEGPLQQLCEEEGLPCLPYFALAQGFLTGKYREGRTVSSSRAPRASGYLDERGLRVLSALDEVSAAHDVSVAAVSLAWLAAQPTVATPIASARTVEQLDDLLPFAELRLEESELELLSDAGR
jgi:aryl-alcohol dehydrogenase-like predicted oxidoreductase